MGAFKALRGVPVVALTAAGLLLVAAVSVFAMSGSASTAQSGAYVYWDNYNASTIGRSNLEGGKSISPSRAPPRCRARLPFYRLSEQTVLVASAGARRASRLIRQPIAPGWSGASGRARPLARVAEARMSEATITAPARPP